MNLASLSFSLAVIPSAQSHVALLPSMIRINETNTIATMSLFPPGLVKHELCFISWLPG